MKLPDGRCVLGHVTYNLIGVSLCTFLIRFAVFVLVLVVEHRQVRLVAAGGDEVIVEGLQHGTARLVGVGAVGEAALPRELEKLLEIAGQLFALHVEGAEALDARGVNKKPLLASPKGRNACGGCSLSLGEGWGERYHFRECRGVHARLVGIADVGHALAGIGHEAVDERGLADTAVAAEQRDLAS